MGGAPGTVLNTIDPVEKEGSMNYLVFTHPVCTTYHKKRLVKNPDGPVKSLASK
jgi:hypothetical protein